MSWWLKHYPALPGICRPQDSFHMPNASTLDVDHGVLSVHRKNELAPKAASFGKSISSMRSATGARPCGVMGPVFNRTGSLSVGKM